jgi:hypothetical protein
MALKYLYVPSGYKAGTAYGVLPNDSTADFKHFVRNTFATRTNKDGLIEACGTSDVNLVTNGDFATDDDWVVSDSSITISGGKANFTDTPSGNTLQLDNFLTTGKTYEVSFTVFNYVEGAIKVRRPFITPSVSSNGVHTVTGIAVTSSGGSDDLQLQVIGETTLKIDDVSVRQILNDVPRIDYSDGGCPSLLLERGKTNIATYSEDALSWGLNNSSTWGGTRTSNALTSPDGRKSADLIHVVQQSGVYIPHMNVTQGSTYSSSVYAKHVSGTSILKFALTSNFYTGTDSQERGIFVDLSDGSIISNTIGSAANVKVIDVGNGWYRLCIQNHVARATGTAAVTCYAQDTSFMKYSVWGGQVEIGSTCTSYIPNLYNSVTSRSKDRAGWAANFSGMNSHEGVLEARFRAVPTNVSNRITLGTSTNGDNHNRLTIGYAINGGVIKPFVLMAYDGGGTEESENQSVEMPSSFNIFEYNTYKFKFKAGNNELKINGELVALGNTMANLDFSFSNALVSISLNLFWGSTSNEFYGGIQHIKVYDSVTDF